jgi:hypothetical protein
MGGEINDIDLFNLERGRAIFVRVEIHDTLLIQNNNEGVG